MHDRLQELSASVCTFLAYCPRSEGGRRRSWEGDEIRLHCLFMESRGRIYA